MDKSRMELSDAEKSLRDAAFEYHRAPTFGKISVTPLHIDLTHQPTVHALKGQLGGAPPKA